MTTRTFVKLFLVGMAALVLISAAATLAAANTVPSSTVGTLSAPVDANALKPPECAALNLTGIVAGSGNINGGNGNELILGSPMDDKINGQNGDDCILGGGGDDDINGGPGNDVCIGGPGNDIPRNCESQFP